MKPLDLQNSQGMFPVSLAGIPGQSHASARHIYYRFFFCFSQMSQVGFTWGEVKHAGSKDVSEDTTWCTYVSPINYKNSVPLFPAELCSQICININMWTWKWSWNWKPATESRTSEAGHTVLSSVSGYLLHLGDARRCQDISRCRCCVPGDPLPTLLDLPLSWHVSLATDKWGDWVQLVGG